MTRNVVPPSENWLTIAQVADDLGFTTRTIRRMAKRGDFKSARQWGGRWMFSRKLWDAEMHGQYRTPAPISELENLKGGQ